MTELGDAVLLLNGFLATEFELGVKWRRVCGMFDVLGVGIVPPIGLFGKD